MITGISGSGKTTLGKILTKSISEKDGVSCVFIDADNLSQTDQSSFEDKSLIERLLMDFHGTINNILISQPILLVGSGFIASSLPVQARIHIHLTTGSSLVDIENRYISYQVRDQISYDEEKARSVVRKVLIPFYHKIVRESDISHLVNVYQENGVRVPLDEIVNVINGIVGESRSSHHVMDISEPFFSQIRSGKKPVEGRKISKIWSKVRRGDTMTITCKDMESFTVEVTAITMYLPSVGDPLGEYLTQEKLGRALPGVKSIEEGRKIYLHWSTDEEIRRMGMMGIQVKVL